MTRSSSARAPEGADGGVCRPPAGGQKRQHGEVPRGKEWIRPFQRAQRALDSSASRIFKTLFAVEEAGRCAEECPLQAAAILAGAIQHAAVAAQKHEDAKRNLAEVAELVAAEPELQDGEAAEMLALANERCQAVEKHMLFVAREALLGAAEHLGDLASGELVPEEIPAADDRPRPRIVIRHRPLFVRAFLAARRQPRAGDRIAPLLLRRRRTPRPAEVRVPRRNLRGRAPPLSSTCSL